MYYDLRDCETGETHGSNYRKISEKFVKEENSKNLKLVITEKKTKKSGFADNHVIDIAGDDISGNDISGNDISGNDLWCKNLEYHLGINL